MTYEEFAAKIKDQAYRYNIDLAGNEYDAEQIPEDAPEVAYAYACLTDKLELRIECGKYEDGIHCKQIAVPILRDDTEEDVIRNLYTVYDVWSQAD